MKYNKTLKKLCQFFCMEYAALVKGKHIHSALPPAIFAAQLSPNAVYSIQTGSSAVSITFEATGGSIVW